MSATEPSKPRRARDEDRSENDQRAHDRLDAAVAGRVPPHDLDAEAAVLSACMLRGGTEALDEVSPILSAEDFYSEAHRRIFEALADLAAHGQPIDAIQVGSWLKERQRLDQVGGAAYLNQVLEAAPVITTRHLQAYARRVANRARMRRLALKLRVATARIYAGVPDEEAEDLFAEIERDVAAICASRHAGGLEKVGPIAFDVMKDFDSHRAGGGGIAGVATGFERLDRQTGGLHEGDLTIIAARPGIGKSALVMGLCDNITDTEQYAGAFFSLEMPRKQLVARLLCARGRVNLAKSRLGAFSPSDWQKLTTASSEVYAKHIYIDDQSGQSLPMIRAKVRRLQSQLARERRRLALVVIDYLQLMRTRTRKGGETRSELIGEITRGLKELAKELSVSIVLLSQLNRDVEKREDKRPLISDLRDSGEIEQDADNILMLYRDDYYYADSDERGIAEIIIAKQRSGPTGTVKVRFDKEWTRFDNLSEADEYSHPVDDGQPYERGEFYASPPEPVGDGNFFNTEGL